MRVPSVFSESPQGPLYLAAPRNDRKQMAGVDVFFVCSGAAACPKEGLIETTVAAKIATNGSALNHDLVLFIMRW